MAAHQLIGGSPKLNLIGFVFYSISLGVLFFGHFSDLVFLTVSAALGLHLALLTILLRASVFCWTCVTVALLNLTATGSLFYKFLELRWVSFLVVVLTYVLGLYLVKWLRVQMQLNSMEASVNHAIAYLSKKENKNQLTGKNTLIIFSRENCSPCEQYKEEILPEVVSQLEQTEMRIKIEVVSSDSGTATPSALVVGRFAASLPFLLFDTTDIVCVAKTIAGDISLDEESFPGFIIPSETYPGSFIE